MTNAQKTLTAIRAVWLLVFLYACPAAARSAFDIYLAAEAQEIEDPQPRPAVQTHAVKAKNSSLADAPARRAARSIAEEYGIPPRLYEALCEFESGFRFARGASGEYGYAQIMPATGQMLQDNGHVKNTWRSDPLENLRAGAAHLSNLKASLTKEELKYAKKHGYNLWAILLAQYNAGKAGVARYIRADGKLSGKQEWYIYNVLKIYNKLDR